jgi:hypothetical protein
MAELAVASHGRAARPPRRRQVLGLYAKPV